MAPEVLVPATVASGALLWGAAHDLAARTIPDTVPVVVALAGLSLRLGSGDALAGLAVAALVFGLAWAGWCAHALGGGDVKLLGAVALLPAPAAVPTLLLAIALAGGVLALAHLLLRPLLPATAAAPGAGLRRFLRIEAWRIRRRGPLPYAVAIATGALLTLGSS